jgi:alkyldihydroxyacetonephosphate synthase
VFLDIEDTARRVILQNGGSLSHHHGVGKIRASFVPSINSPAFQEVQKKIKEGLDPLNIFGARNGSFADTEANDTSCKVEGTDVVTGSDPS